jgi:hypothetical protein
MRMFYFTLLSFTLLIQSIKTKQLLIICHLQNLFE